MFTVWISIINVRIKTFCLSSSSSSRVSTYSYTERRQKSFQTQSWQVWCSSCSLICCKTPYVTALMGTFVFFLARSLVCCLGGHFILNVILSWMSFFFSFGVIECICQSLYLVFNVIVIVPVSFPVIKLVYLQESATPFVN